MTNAYETAYRRSLEDPAGFWGDAAADIRWFKTWDKVLDDSKAPFYRWFTGGQVNTCFNAVDRHVEEGRGAQAAQEVGGGMLLPGRLRALSGPFLPEPGDDRAGPLALP